MFIGYLFTLFKSKSYATVTIVVKSALPVLNAYPYQEEVWALWKVCTTSTTYKIKYVHDTSNENNIKIVRVYWRTIFSALHIFKVHFYLHLGKNYLVDLDLGDSNEKSSFACSSLTKHIYHNTYVHLVPA